MVHPACIGYAIIFTDDAKKELQKLEKQTIKQIFKKTKELISAKSNNLNIKKLKSMTSLYRLRVGNYRVIYCIKHEKIKEISMKLIKNTISINKLKTSYLFSIICF